MSARVGYCLLVAPADLNSMAPYFSSRAFSSSVRLSRTLRSAELLSQHCCVIAAAPLRYARPIYARGKTAERVSFYLSTSLKPFAIVYILCSNDFYFLALANYCGNLSRNKPATIFTL